MTDAAGRLHAIVDVEVAGNAGWTPADLVEAFLDGGARTIQIRAKRLGSGAYLELCDAAVRLATPCGAAIIVNDRADLARLSGAAGVHVGQDDLPPNEARALLGPNAVVGLSTHTVPQLEASRGAPASYVAVGPVFGTRTKDTGYTGVGLELVAAAVRLVPDRPIVAIGGITLETAPSVLAAGATAVAVISDLLVERPAARVEAYLRRLQEPG